MKLLEVNGQLTMSSLELVEYINDDRGDGVAQLRHSDFLEKVFIVLGDKCSGNFRSTYKASNGKENPCYNFPKREACLMVMSYSYEVQAKIFDRWQELEAKQALKLPDFTNPAIAARAWADEVEAKLIAVAQLEAQKPMMAAYEVLADRKQDVTTTVVAKHCGTTAIKLNLFLREKGVKMLGIDAPKAGYMEWFNLVSDVAKNGHEFHSCLVTPLGQLKIAEMWAKK